MAQFEADAGRYGIPLEWLLATLPDEPEEFEIWPENLQSLEVFLACSTQWNVHFSGKAQGLNYPALEAVLRMQGCMEQQQIFEDLRAMEYAALDEFNKGA